MIFAFVSLRAGTVGGLPNRNSKRLFSRTSNEISKKAVRFSLEVGRCRKAPRHQLFSEFFAKAIKMSGQFVYGGDFRFSYLLIKYRKVSGSDDTRNQFASNRTWVRIPSSPPKKSSKLKGLLDFPFLPSFLNSPIFRVRTARFSC